MGGEIGGIPVMIEDKRGDKRLTAREYENGRKKTAAEIGQNNGKKILPSPTA